MAHWDPETLDRGRLVTFSQLNVPLLTQMSAWGLKRVMVSRSIPRGREVRAGW